MFFPFLEHVGTSRDTSIPARRLSKKKHQRVFIILLRVMKKDRDYLTKISFPKETLPSK